MPNHLHICFSSNPYCNVNICNPMPAGGLIRGITRNPSIYQAYFSAHLAVERRQRSSAHEQTHLIVAALGLDTLQTRLHACVSIN